MGRVKSRQPKPAGGEGEDRFASAFGRLDAARRRHKRAARLDAGRAAWMSLLPYL